MKKHILLLLGLSLSLICAGSTTIPQIQHDYGTVYADPFSCEYTFQVFSSLHNAQYTAYYYLYNETPFDQNKDTVSLTKGYGYYTIIVASGNSQRTGAPAQQPSQSTYIIPEEDLPVPTGFYVDRYDVFTILVRHPVVEHYDTLYVDMMTHMVDYQLYSTVGQQEEGRAYCVTDADMCDIFKDQTSLTVVQRSSLPYDITLGEGDYTYYVLAGDERINAPQRRPAGITLPYSQSVNDVWADAFILHVVQAECDDRLVYTKWDDVLFVDNGGNLPEYERGSFVSYQWYNEGAMIEGETGQWMRIKGTPTGRYYAKITDRNGQTIFTCPAEFDDLPASEQSNPHNAQSGTGAQKRLSNGQLIIECNGATYNAQGAPLR